MPTRGSKDPNGRALRGRRAHTTFALLTDPARQIWNSFNNRANAGGADAPEAAVNGCLYDRFKSLYNKTATKPSLVIVPARFKSGTLYSQIPSSNADFTVTRPLNTATRFDSSALIQTGITSGVPRLDYYTSGGVTGCPALLVEPAATNLVPSGTVYTALASSLVSAVTDTPAIGVSGALCTKNTASGSTAYIRQLFSAVALSSGTIYSVSRFFKYNGVAFNTTLEAEGSTQWGGVAFKQVIVLSAASGVTIGASTSCTGSVENFGNGWYRVNVRVTTGATIGGSANVTVLSELPSALSTGQGFLTACPQLETGSVATSYIPTPAGSASRSADVISVSGAVSGCIGQTEGTIYAEFEIRSNSANRRLIALSDNTSTNSIFIWSLSNVLYAQIQAQTITIINPISDGRHKVALAYQQNGVSGSVFISLDGGAIVSGTSATYPSSLFAINVGKNEATNTSSLFFNDRIRAVALYTTRLTNAELAAMTQL